MAQKYTTSHNGARQRKGRTTPRAAAEWWSAGWNDGITGAAWRDLLGHPQWHQTNYEMGRLYGVEARVKRLPAKTWLMRGGNTATVPYPAHLLALTPHLQDAVPPTVSAP
jgi:hypothetical protein